MVPIEHLQGEGISRRYPERDCRLGIHPQTVLYSMFRFTLIMTSRIQSVTIRRRAVTREDRAPHLDLAATDVDATAHRHQRQERRRLHGHDPPRYHLAVVSSKDESTSGKTLAKGNQAIQINSRLDCPRKIQNDIRVPINERDLPTSQCSPWLTTTMTTTTMTNPQG